jgi:predicted outer membrane repeat protein
MRQVLGTVRGVRRAALAFCALAASMALPSSVQAATFEVTRTDDPAPAGCQPRHCSLREAVIAANRHRGPDRIVLRSGADYELTRVGAGENESRTGDLDYDGELRVFASGTARARIDGSAVELIFDSRAREGHARFANLSLVGGTKGAVDSWGDVVVARTWVGRSGGVGVSARDVFLRRSRIVKHGSTGVHAFAGAQIERSRIRRNGFGGLYVCGRLQMVDTVVEMNTTGWMMAGVQLGDYDTSSPDCERTPPFRIARSKIRANRYDYSDALKPGGGLAAGRYSEGGVIRNSFISHNQGDRGGIEADGVRLFNSEVRSNIDRSDDGAGGVTGRDVRIVRSTIAKNIGPTGGALLDSGRVRASTVSRNVALEDGGGIAGTDASIVNSTLAHNEAAGSGGGIFADAGLSLRSSTVAYNAADEDLPRGDTGGGVFAAGEAGVYEVRNSIIALNQAFPGAPQDCAGSFDLARNTVLTFLDATCTGFGDASNIVTSEPGIASLGQNGGPTATIRLLAGSPAIDAAAAASSPAIDQRGVDRDAQPDMGAFERRR